MMLNVCFIESSHRIKEANFYFHRVRDGYMNGQKRLIEKKKTRLYAEKNFEMINCLFRNSFRHQAEF